MRPTLEYLKEKFDYYNKLCFEGKLPSLPIRLNLRNSYIGLTIAKVHRAQNGKVHYQLLGIEISVRMDLPEEEYINTLVHEMIHCYIFHNDIVDNSTHGSVFKQKMQEINETYGTNITTTFNPTDEWLINNYSHTRCICVGEFENGDTGLAVVARNKMFLLWKYMPKIPGVTKVHWYASNRAIFSKFPVTLRPALIIEDAGKIHHYLAGARELCNTGRVIKVKQSE